MDEIRYREFALRADCQRDPEGLAALDRLGWDTFRLKLRAWYETGCWQEGTRALTLFREREAVSSLFASSMELSWLGKAREAKRASSHRSQVHGQTAGYLRKGSQ